MIISINYFQMEKKRSNFYLFHSRRWIFFLKKKTWNDVALLICTYTWNIDIGWRYYLSISFFLWSKSWRYRSKIKILKMMLKSSDIQIRKTYFFIQNKKGVRIFDGRYILYYVQISKITWENFFIIYYEYFIRVEDRKYRSLSNKADNRDCTSIKFIIDQRRDIKYRKFFFLFISSTILRRWNYFWKSEKRFPTQTSWRRWLSYI